MTGSSTPAVERANPPAVVTRVGNPVLTLLLSGRRRSTRVGQSLILVQVRGRRSGPGLLDPVAYHRWTDGSLVVLTSSTCRVNLRGGPTLGSPRSGAGVPPRRCSMKIPSWWLVSIGS